MKATHNKHKNSLQGHQIHTQHTEHGISWPTNRVANRSTSPKTQNQIPNFHDTLTPVFSGADENWSTTEDKWPITDDEIKAAQKRFSARGPIGSDNAMETDSASATIAQLG